MDRRTDDAIREARAISAIEGYEPDPGLDRNIREVLEGRRTVDQFTQEVLEHAQVDSSGDEPRI